MNTSLTYLTGINNHAESECLPGALIKGRNAPQRTPYGLYAEQISGTSFTMPRHLNLHSWLYRIRPSVVHEEFQLIKNNMFQSAPFTQDFTPPTQMRWNPIPYPKHQHDFIRGIFTFAANGSTETQTGAAIHLYTANASMKNDYFYNADGEMLIVPQEGRLRFKTEFGLLDVAPGEIIVIPRGVKFQVELRQEAVRGYICENYGAPFRLPELGPIGANGLANPRDFQKPVAHFEEREDNFKLIAKFQGKLWSADINHSPLDVVAWHGTLSPYKYNLRLFNTIGSISYDHPDPSIFTVLTSPSTVTGAANVDFVIFPPRWMVTEDTFRPPYYHRNIMSEYMGLIDGVYDAKETGFLPGGSSLHNCMSAHGPDSDAYDKATSGTLKPEYYDDIMAFMFESSQVWRLTKEAYQASFKQKDYLTCWRDLKNHFSQKTLTHS